LAAENWVAKLISTNLTEKYRSLHHRNVSGSSAHLTMEWVMMPDLTQRTTQTPTKRLQKRITINNI
ncbi:hypothetical protein, partial [Pediococcus acidilactici]|uniref:hypothetical protein n=1 Tax=Pediococcus acidilactici TaxID=1254 RepID=UPI000AE819A9